MHVGTQFTGALEAGQSGRWITHSWPADWHVVWHVMPATPVPGAPEIEWEVDVECATAEHVTYWLTVRNLSGAPVDFDARFAVLS